MIKELTIDTKFLHANWPEESWDEVTNICEAICINKDCDIPVYQCDDSWVKTGIYNESKKILESLCEYGYCDTEDALIKYLQKFKDDAENAYFVEVHLMSMDYEKYYKNGSYINKDGIDTEDDYYAYIDEHPEMKVEQDYENNWIKFTISKIELCHQS